MNNCSQAPQTDATLAAAHAFLESWGRDGMDWEAWVDEVERARTSFARLINAEPDEVAVTSSVSHAASALAPGTPVTDDAYMAAVHAKAQRRGVEVHWVNPPVTRVPQQQQ